MASRTETAGTVTIMGSGEMMEVMGKVHRAVMGRIAGPVQAAFLDTPAGFQLNADDLSQKAAEYFKQRFDLPLAIASYKKAAAATPAEVSAVLSALDAANYIFAGPGSPTYAVRNWLRTPIQAALEKRFQEGAHIVFASAAAITLGRFVLPIYEIYKVGNEPHWMEGLNLLTPAGLDLAIVPHWNNAEGHNHDTRFCFMGEPRLKALEALLPESTIMLGVDEYTACTIDLGAREFIVAGNGGVTVRHKGIEHVYAAGCCYPLEGLEPASAPVPPREKREAGGPDGDSPEGLVQRANLARLDFTRALDAADFASAAREIDGLLEALGESPISGGEAALPQQIRAMLNELVRVWGAAPPGTPPPADPLAAAQPYIASLVEVRARLRAAKQWALADEVRDELGRLGIALEDTPEGTNWKAA
jgi:hypothetical protein